MNIDEIIKAIPRAKSIEEAKQVLIDYVQPYENTIDEGNLLFAALEFKAYADKLEAMLKLAVKDRNELIDVMPRSMMAGPDSTKRFYDDKLERIARGEAEAKQEKP